MSDPQLFILSLLGLLFSVGYYLQVVTEKDELKNIIIIIVVIIIINRRSQKGPNL